MRIDKRQKVDAKGVKILNCDFQVSGLGHIIDAGIRYTSKEKDTLASWLKNII